MEAVEFHFLLGFLHRYLAEIVVFGTISVMMVTEFSNNLTPEIGILFGVILRVFPTINRVGSSLNTLAYANPSLKALETRHRMPACHQASQKTQLIRFLKR